MIDLVDYGGGNLGSITRCLERLGVRYRIVTGAQPPTGDHPLVFPGVGAFGAAMNNIEQGGLAPVIRKLVRGGTPYLGICIGLQVLFEGSEEAPGVDGLGLAPGRVVKFKPAPGLKIPQIGWNYITRGAAAGAENDPSDAGGDWPEGHVYFVNSYYPAPASGADVLYRAHYGAPFCAAIRTGNITAFQFHPEKSGAFGQDLMRRWLVEVGESRGALPPDADELHAPASPGAAAVQNAEAAS